MDPIEVAFSSSNCSFLLGTDEVGRGPLAGPVVAATTFIAFPKNFKNKETYWRKCREFGINDSKLISEKNRKVILEKFQLNPDSLKINKIIHFELNGLQVSSYIAQVGEEEIDSINILNATFKAFWESILGLSPLLESAEKNPWLIDGNKIPTRPPQEIQKQKILDRLLPTPLVKGDQRSILIGLSSLIAKIYRDSLMEKLDQKYFGYGLAKHKGYPTKDHKEAIKKLGPSPIHRKSFGGVKECFQGAVLNQDNV